MLLDIVIQISLLALGFVALVKGADVLVDGASILAKKLGVSELVVGLTIVAFGTSLPELIVSLLADSKGEPELAIGNILGSNIANILLILGVSALIKPLTVTRVTVWREILFSMGAGGVLAVLVADEFLGLSTFVGLDAIDGIMLMTFFALFMYYSFGRARIDDKQAEEQIDHDHKASLANTFLKAAVGVAGLAVGGQLIIENAQSLAATIGINESIVGLSIVALGTSAPELAASVAAVRNNKVDIAVGNVVGSNIFNTFWVLGIAAIMNPLPFASSTYIDVLAASAAGVLLFGFMAFTKPRHTLNKTNGFVFLALYIIYVASLVVRGVV